MTFSVITASKKAHELMLDTDGVVRPMYSVTSWNPRKSIVQIVKFPLLLNYGFVHESIWEDLYSFLFERGWRMNRIMIEGEPFRLDGDIVRGMDERARAGEWDVYRAGKGRSNVFKKVRKVGVGEGVSIDIGGIKIDGGIVANSDENRVEIHLPNTSVRVVVR